jgi:hypothetical protein
MPKKMKMEDADGVRAEVVVSEDMGGDEEEIILSTNMALKAVVTLVAGKQGKVGVVLKDWVKAVLLKITAVGITTLRELVEGILTLNQRLRRERLPELHRATVQALLMEAVYLVYWPESEERGEFSK